MGTLMGHIVPGLAFFLLGLWHTTNTIKAYFVKGPSNFTVRFWYQFNSFHSTTLRHLELISIISFSILAISLQLLDFPSFHFVFELDSFEHVTMFLQLIVFASFIICAEFFTPDSSFELFSGFVGILASSVFAQELFLLHFHSTDHVGIEGHYHWLLQLIVLISLLASISATCFPKSFPAALVLSISVMFQGCWFLIMGFMLWVPALVPQGCSLNDLGKTKKTGHNHNSLLGAISCGSDDADFRARALANLQFSWIFFAILIASGIVFLKVASSRRSNISDRLVEYQRLHSRVADSTMTTESLKLVSSQFVKQEET